MGEYFSNLVAQQEKMSYQMEQPLNLYAIPLPERLKNQVADLQHRQDRIKEFIDLLDKNPDFERLLTLAREVL